MNHLARRAAGDQPVKHAPQDEGGPTLSTDGTQWDGVVLDIASTGIAAAPHDGPVIYSALVAQPGVRRGPRQQWYRSRIGWIAQQRGMTVVETRQPLSALPDGRFRPSGKWANFTIQRCAATSAPTRRIGDVAADDSAASAPHAPPTAPPGGGQPEVPADVDYLPLALRQGLSAVATNPTWFEAQAVEFTRPDGSSYHSVGVIKINDVEAVSLLASRQSGSRTWQAEQVWFTYNRSDDVAVPQ